MNKIKPVVFEYRNSSIPQPPKVKTVKNNGKVGRNDPCPCGSGKKAKKCCWDDINRIVYIDKKKLRKMSPEAIDELIDDLETDKYGEEYIRSRTTATE